MGREDPQLGQQSDQLWDCQVSSMDASIYPVTTNLPMISLYFSEDEVLHVAEVLLSSLLQKTPDYATEKLSVSLISKHLLESLILVELPMTYSAMVRCVTQRIVGILSSTPDMTPGHPALMKLSEVSCSTAEDKVSAVTQSDGDVTEAPSALKRLEAIAQHILSSSTTGASITLSQSQADNLLSLLQVTDALNPDRMSSEDFSGLFLFLFLMVTDTQLHKDVKPAVTIHLPNQLFSLMGSLLAGNNSHHVLKIVHGSSLLEAALAALLSHCNKGLSNCGQLCLADFPKNHP